MDHYPSPCTTTLLSPAEAAKLLGISFVALSRYVRDKVGPAHFHHPGSGQTFYILDDLLAWTPPAKEAAPPRRRPRPYSGRYPVDVLEDEYLCWTRIETAKFLGVTPGYLHQLRGMELDPPSLPQEHVERNAIMYQRGGVQEYRRVFDQARAAHRPAEAARKQARAAAEKWIRDHGGPVPPPPAPATGGAQ